MMSHYCVCPDPYSCLSEPFVPILMGKVVVFVCVCDCVHALLSINILACTIRVGQFNHFIYPFMELLPYLITAVSFTVLVLPLLFYLVTFGRALIYSSIGISLKSHGLRVLSPGYVIFLPTSDVI